MMANLDCLLNGVQNHYENKSLGMSMKDFSRLGLGRKTHPDYRLSHSIDWGPKQYTKEKAY